MIISYMGKLEIMSNQKNYLLFLYLVTILVAQASFGNSLVYAQHSNIDEDKHESKNKHENQHESIDDITPELAVSNKKLIFLKNHHPSIDDEDHIVSPTVGNIIKYLPLLGQVIFNPNQYSKLAPRYSGLVLNIKKTVGDYIRKGQTLAVIEENVGLQQYRFTSPLNGTVITRNLAEGEYVPEGKSSFSVANLKVLWAKLNVRQEHISKISNNQKILIVSKFKKNGLSKKTYGKIFFVSPIIDEHTMTGKILLTVKNKQGNWHPGESIDGYIPIGKFKPSLILTKKAIVKKGDKNGVFSIINNKIFWKEIILGESDQKNYQVLKGIQKHNVLLLNNHNELKHILSDKLKDASDHHGH